MRTFRRYLSTMLLFLPCGVGSQAAPAVAITGRWAGTGTFFDKSLREKAGPVALDLEFGGNGSATGSVGKARLRDARVRAVRELIELSAALDGAIADNSLLDKDHVVLLVTRRDSLSIDAEFHLKSNRYFDPRMREGHVTLRRVR